LEPAPGSHSLQKGSKGNRISAETWHSTSQLSCTCPGQLAEAKHYGSANTPFILEMTYVGHSKIRNWTV